VTSSWFFIPQLVSSDVSAAVQLSIPFFWDMTLCQWVIGYVVAKPVEPWRSVQYFPSKRPDRIIHWRNVLS